MATIKLNGTPVSLTTQRPETFARIAHMALPQMPKSPLPAVLAALLADAQKNSIGADHEMVQASLWMLHEMGARAVEVNPEELSLKITEHIPAEQMARDTTDPFTTGNIATGRAMVVALHNRAKRQFRLNGEVIELKPGTLEEMKKTIAGIHALRRVNEDHLSAMARYIGGLSRQEGFRESVPFRCATSIISDFGVSAIRVDAEKGELSIEGLNEADAMCGTYLQGGTPEQIRQSRDRVRTLLQRARTAAEKAGATASQTGSVEVPGPAPFKRRRRD